MLSTQGRELTAVATEAGATLIAGSSLKAALDLNWDEPNERHRALGLVLAALESVECWLQPQTELKKTSGVESSLAIAHQVQTQDVQTSTDGIPQLRRGVAPSRRITVEDPTMRHGRKSRSHKFNGYKRHVLRDLDTGLVRAVGVTPAFVLDWERQKISCPNHVSVPFQLGGTVQFPADACAVCPLHSRCTTNKRGRTVSIHADERLLQELRQRQLTTLGRAKLLSSGGSRAFFGSCRTYSRSTRPLSEFTQKPL